jgi:hypothetical protein
MRYLASSALFVALVADAVAQQDAPALPQPPLPPNPTKEIRIYNNTNGPIFVLIQIPIRPKPDYDTWMQAQFKVSDWGPSWNTERRFNMTKLYRAYIEVGRNPSGLLEKTYGIAPLGQFVKITVPFYTQLRKVSKDDLGKIDDQFINWWNAGRVYMFDTEAGYHSAKAFNTDNKSIPGGGLPPAPVSPLTGAVTPTCTSSDGKECKVVLIEYAANPSFNIPFELAEYTFAAAEGPPTHLKQLTINTAIVNYNVSSLDSVFLPVAMGPINNKQVPYIGTTMSVDAFRKALQNFSSLSSLGDRWPYYVPVYYYDRKYTDFPSGAAEACSLKVLAGAQYKLPAIPGARFTIEESYKQPTPPSPPAVSSNPAQWKSKYNPDTKGRCDGGLSPAPSFVDPPDLGALAKGMVTYWRDCTENNRQSDTCSQIRQVQKLFTDSYEKACPGKPPIPFYTMMIAVYGWSRVEYMGCKGLDLAQTWSKSEHKSALQTYCNLQYNYATGATGAAIFNPYARLIHSPSSEGGLGSSAYAFSIDDKLSFKSVKGDGIILAVGGAKDLENKDPTDIPNSKASVINHCQNM